MPKNAIFYLLSDSFFGQNGSEFSLDEQAALQILLSEFKRRKKIYVHCDSKAQAERFDEYLWQLPTANFCAHTLSGEGEKSAAPIELGWHDLKTQRHFDVFINLQQTLPRVLASKSAVIDFVPQDEVAKVSARDRYRFYQNEGFQMRTQPFYGESF